MTRCGRPPRTRRPASGPSAWKGSCTSPAAAARSPRPRRCRLSCSRRSTARWPGSGPGRSRSWRGVLRGRHAGMALAARLALEQLTDDDSRAVAAAATAALGAPAPAPPAPPRPELVLSATVIDLGRLPQHGQSPEHRVRIGNAGGGDLNARAAASASWLKLRQVGDELVVAVDTSAAGEYEGTVTVDSDGGTATIRVHARVDPRQLPASEAAATIHPEPVPETPAAARPGPQQDPALAMASSAPRMRSRRLRRRHPHRRTSAAGQTDARPDVGPAAPSDGGEQRTTPPPRDDHPRVAAAGLDQVRRENTTSTPPSPRRPHHPASAGDHRHRYRHRRHRPGHRDHHLCHACQAAGTPCPGTCAVPPLGLHHRKPCRFPPGGGRRHRLRRQRRRQGVRAGRRHRPPPLGLHHRRQSLPPARRWSAAPSTSAATTTRCTRWTPPPATSAGPTPPEIAVDSSPAVAGGTVYVGSHDGKVYALDAATGHLRWSYTTGGSRSTPARRWPAAPSTSAATTARCTRWTPPPATSAGPTPPEAPSSPARRWRAAPSTSAASTTRCTRWTPPPATSAGPTPPENVSLRARRWSGGTVYIGSDDDKVYALDAGS